MSGFSLSAGASRLDITPELLAGLNPFGTDFVSVRDRLFARALVLDDGRTRVAIVALDLVEVGDTTAIRERIEQELGIPAGQVMLAPSHSHNAPRIGLVPPGGKARIPTTESLEYTEVVYDAIISVIGRAIDDLEPAQLGSGHGAVDVNISRDGWVDGQFTLAHNPHGASDKTLHVVSVRRRGGSPIAVVMNYAVHSTVSLGVPEVSADLAGAAAAFVERELGGDCVALWLSGALGDQAPRMELGSPTADADRDRRFVDDAVRAQGILVGGAVLDVLREVPSHRSDLRVFGRTRVVACPARRLPVPPGMEQADVDTVDLTLTCLLVGPIAFAGVSGEATVAVYRSLLAASPLTTTLLVSNVNARIGYLPADEAYDRHTQAADGCPIVQGYAERTVVEGLTGLVEDGMACAPGV